MRIAALGLATTLALSVLPKGCSAEPEKSCTISARDSQSITLMCDGVEDKREGIYSDLYPKCQVGQPWPSCKEK